MYVHILLDILQSKPVVFGLRFSLGSSDNESIIQTIHCAETSEADPENSLENEENATRKRARIVNEDNGNSDSSEPEVIEQTTAQPEKKRVQGSITSFFSGQIGSAQKSAKKAKAYTKVKEKTPNRDVHVCLTCVNDPTLNDKKTAILCRGNLHQMKRHYRRHHQKKGEECERTCKEYFIDIVPMNHVSVPSKIRRLDKSHKTNVKNGTDNRDNCSTDNVSHSKDGEINKTIV